MITQPQPWFTRSFDDKRRFPVGIVISVPRDDPTSILHCHGVAILVVAVRQLSILKHPIETVMGIGHEKGCHEKGCHPLRPDSDFDLVVVFDDEAPNSEAGHDEVFAPVLDLELC